MYKFYGDLILMMSKRTKFFIFAIFGIMWIGMTKLTFISTGMVKLLNFIMRIFAIGWTVPWIFGIANYMTILIKVRPSFITFTMIINTSFTIMVVLIFSLWFFHTRFCFEIIQIESEKLSILKVKAILLMQIRTI